MRSVFMFQRTIAHSQTEHSEWMSRKRLAAVPALIFALVWGEAGALSMLVSSASRKTFPSYRAALLRITLQQQQQQSHCSSRSSSSSSRSSRLRLQQQRHLLLQREHHLATRTRGGGLYLGMSTASASSAAASSVEGAAMRFGRMQLLNLSCVYVCLVYWYTHIVVTRLAYRRTWYHSFVIHTKRIPVRKSFVYEHVRLVRTYSKPKPSACSPAVDFKPLL